MISFKIGEKPSIDQEHKSPNVECGEKQERGCKTRDTSRCTVRSSPATLLSISFLLASVLRFDESSCKLLVLSESPRKLPRMLHHQERRGSAQRKTQKTYHNPSSVLQIPYTRTCLMQKAMQFIHECPSMYKFPCSPHASLVDCKSSIEPSCSRFSKSRSPAR